MHIIGREGNSILVKTRHEYGFIADMDEQIRYPEKFILDLTKFSAYWQPYHGSDEELERIKRFDVMKL